MKDRCFLLLQGPSSRFFLHLGRALGAKGAKVVRIGCAPGDRVFWSGDAGAYEPLRVRDQTVHGPYRDAIARHGATDLIMLGDGRAPHQAALKAARALGAEAPRAWIVEHGYLRPDLILIEPSGMGARSRIPAAFDAMGVTPSGEDIADPSYPSSFLRYAVGDVCWNLSNLALSWARYPGYRHHALDGPVREYSGWLAKLARTPSRNRAARAATDRIAAHPGAVFLVPLQLATDFQIRRDGTGAELDAILEEIVASFACHAAPDALLVVKVHPLDNGLAPWADMVDRLAEAQGCPNRVAFLDGGDLDAILAQAAGVVTVNSTVGLTALRAGLPVHVLGRAIYARPGLTHGGALSEFWRLRPAPDPVLVKAFTGFLREGFHVPGAFDGPGAVAGAAHLATWLADPPGPARLAAGIAP